MSVPEEQAQELRVKATCGARDGRHKGDTVVVILGILILKHFLLGGLPQWPVDVIQVAQLPFLDGSSVAPQRSWVTERS